MTESRKQSIKSWETYSWRPQAGKNYTWKIQYDFFIELIAQPALCSVSNDLIENVLANDFAASVNYLCELFFAERTDFFQQFGFINCGDLAYHDNAGFW